MKKRWSKKTPIIILLAIILAVIFKSPLGNYLFQIRKFSVDLHGTECVTSSQITQDKIIHQNIIFFPDQKIRQTWLQKYPCVGQVIFHRRFPSQLIVDIYPRVPFLQVSSFLPKPLPSLDNVEASVSTGTALYDWSFPTATSGSILIVDDQGVIFNEGQQANLPLFFYPKDQLKVGDHFDPLLAADLKLITEKMNSFANPINQLRFDGQSFLIQGQQKIVLSFSEEINRQLASLQLILSKAKIDGKAMDKIDLRFDKPVVIYSPQKKT